MINHILSFFPLSNSPSCPETNSVIQAGLELKDPPASASRVLGLKVCATTAQQKNYILFQQIAFGHCLLILVPKRDDVTDWRYQTRKNSRV